ncbi:MAG: hypothetical protein EBY16_07430 [Gammaproteobacteria bacterium]|nr:hypothetical protein [Gammaproteobacteria bacterium]
MTSFDAKTVPQKIFLFGMKLYLKFFKILLESVEYICIMKASREKGEMKMKIGDFVFAEYDNGEIVNGEVINVRMFGDRMLLTVKADQGYRSIYTDKCVTLEVMEASK